MSTIHEKISELLGNPEDTSWRWTDGTAAHAMGARPVAYFSMEFGLHADLAIYSGGLGVLAGDHLKSASDLGVPLVALGLLYREGYFAQRLDDEGWQQEDYPRMDCERLGLRKVQTSDGGSLTVEIETGNGTIHAQAWEVRVGRVRLFLLDTALESNTEEDRSLSARLYSGDSRTRIRQELLLGVGGTRLLQSLGIRPSVVHLNEGHSAFAGLERMRQIMAAENLGPKDAREKVARTTVFTTHTPVPAGHDRFDAGLVDVQLAPLRESLGMSSEELLNLGRVRAGDTSERFCMTVLAARFSHRINGVSNLHGVVSRRMWTDLWPNRKNHEIPIGHITNGVHLPTWIGPEFRALFDRHLEPGWIQRHAFSETWNPVADIPMEELAAAKLSQKRRLLELVGGDVDPDTLLIGFARRFATYKRATLLISDLDRLDALLNHPQYPITIFFAGKAHPRDQGGKTLIRDLYRVSRDPRFRGRLRVLPGYDITLAQHLVQGVDVWLNNPRRPMEASGTSGQKVAFNGGLNCSILDGWWAEGWDGRNGFAIGNNRIHRDPNIQDARDAHELFGVLGREVVPLYYSTDSAGLRNAWLTYVKRAIRTLGWRFSSDRMVQDYVRHSYLPASGFSPVEF